MIASESLKLSRFHDFLFSLEKSFEIFIDWRKKILFPADGASLTQVAFLLTEGSILMGISHSNLHSPIAACMELPGPPQIAYPWPLNGNLKLYVSIGFFFFVVSICE